MPYPVTDVITWAKGSQTLALVGEATKQNTTGGSVDIDLWRKIYVERKSLEWQYSQNPTDSDGILYGQTNYVYDLCFPYVLQANQISGGGGLVIDPVSPSGSSIFPFIVKSSSTKFTSATNYDDPNIVGKNITVFINELGNQFFTAPDDFVYTATGINFIIPGFNAPANDYTLFFDEITTVD